MYDLSHLYTITRGLSILFVEDDPRVLESTTDILKEYFHRIDMATDGESGLIQYKSYLKKHGSPYDLVISDIRMPHMNGIELVREIKKINESQQIIVLSAHQESRYLLELINLGIAHFVLKPLAPEPLFTALSKAARHIHQKRSPLQKSTLIKLGHGAFFDRQNGLLTQHGQTIRLTKNELLLMQLLAKKYETICTVDDIVNSFFDKGVDIYADNVRSLVSRLRRKLPAGAIESIYGLGYKLTSTE